MFLTGSTNQRAETVLKILQLELPLCFKEQNIQPLKINIIKDVLAYFCTETRFTTEDIGLAIKRYQQNSQYLQTILLGAKRIDIYGKVVSFVTKNEAEKALQQLTLKSMFTFSAIDSISKIIS